MGFSEEWEALYQENKQMSIWPWSDLISYVKRYAADISKESKVLELGCGAGANIPFFMNLGVAYFAIEGSKTMVKNLKERYSNYESNIILGDFTKKIDFKEKFDLIIDRSSLTHNSTSDIRRTIEMVYDHLKLGGKYIGINWFSTKHGCYKYGKEVEDQYTKRADEGYFKDMGNVHFSTKEHIEDLFSDFEIEIMEEKLITKYIPENDVFASWNFVAKKKVNSL